MKPDTIVVRGKFLGGCDMPKMIKMAEHNELSAPWKEIAVNANGEFVYKTYLTEPRRIAMRTEKRANYDFIATTDKKLYQIEVNCINKIEKLELKDSPENAAYHAFALANRKFRNEIDSFASQDITKPEVFAKLKNRITNYHKTINEIAAGNPESFTAKVLVAAEMLPDGSLESADALRKNFLNREAFANPYIYNEFLGGRIVSNYLAICDRNADQSEIVATLMKIGVKNPEAAKRLQQVAYNNFYNRKEEALLMGYIKWAEANPSVMYNNTVKSSLTRLKKVMPGNQYSEITLNDPTGKPRKLSESVTGSKLTLLIFYSPTCDHCQAEIPQIKPIWDQYKSKGLKIYIVGFDATNDEWAWFIKEKAYAEWAHVFDTSQNVSYQYVVNYTPTYILIDAQGKIITRMAEFEDIKTDIPKILN
jgi:thiol-disulfide isomerase/thioredoxin